MDILTRISVVKKKQHSVYDMMLLLKIKIKMRIYSQLCSTVVSFRGERLEFKGYKMLTASFERQKI